MFGFTRHKGRLQLLCSYHRWDAALFLGVEGQDFASTVWGVLILLLNLLVQVGFPPATLSSNASCTYVTAPHLVV